MAYALFVQYQLHDEPCPLCIFQRVAVIALGVVFLVAFLQAMNKAVYGAHPGFFTVAEESTSWPGVSRPAHDGGLG